jgi:predicted enzyme related to lactoylglutathione lyase
MPSRDPPLVIAVDTHDLPRAVAFWRDALGCAVHEDASPEFVMVTLRPGAALCIDAAPKRSPLHPAPRVLFSVDDVGARERDLTAKGLHVHQQSSASSERPWFSVLDPDGREVIFQGA